MNTESTQLVLTTEILIFSWKESTSTTTKPLVVVMFQEQSLWIWNQEPWIPLELDLSVNSSDLITSSLAKPEPETTGPKVIIPKVPSLLTQYSMWSEKKLKDATASKDSKSPTLWVVVQDLVWVLF
jgi:hypothetical protein